MITRNTDVSVVAAQLAAWAVLILLGDGERVVTTPYLMAILGSGIALALFSGLQLGSRSYTPSTRPRASNVFVGRGIYRYVRHPIYLALFVASLAFFLSRPTFVVGLAYLVVVLITNARVGLEEGMLEQRYPEYAEYRTRTKRYVPFVI
jgi:protein-S-isoprenylcysteine O-methyltransferase Ste14